MPSPGLASPLWGTWAGLWALEVQGGREVLVSCLRQAGNPPLSGRLAPAVLGLGPAEREVQGEGAPGAQFPHGSAGSRTSPAWRLS